MANVRFIETTKTAYDAIKSDDSAIDLSAIYFLTDTGQIYKGRTLMTDQEVVEGLNNKENLTFKGTLAEWNGLTTEEKNAYNTAFVSEDVGSGISVADTIEEGNLNPVTSNAVYAELNRVIDVTPTFINTPTGMSINDITCRLISPKTYFLSFSINITTEFSGCNYTMGQFLMPIIKIGDAQVYGLLSGKMWCSVYVSDSQTYDATMPVTYAPYTPWAFIGRQSGLADVSSSSKIVTKDSRSSRFGGIVFIN